jgi:hypothetical protein
MQRIPVGINHQEDHNTIVITPQSVPPEGLSVGERIIIFEPGIECEAIVRHGTSHEWVADIVEGTIRDLDE